MLHPSFVFISNLINRKNRGPCYILESVSTSSIEVFVVDAATHDVDAVDDTNDVKKITGELKAIAYKRETDGIRNCKNDW